MIEIGFQVHDTAFQNQHSAVTERQGMRALHVNRHAELLHGAAVGDIVGLGDIFRGYSR